MEVKRVAVIGGGISGLTVAYRLEPYVRSGQLEVHLFESGERLGGVIQTDREHGAILEGGPDSLVRRKPEAAELCSELGLGSHLIGTNTDVRGAYIFHRQRLYPIPQGVAQGVPTDLGAMWRSPLLSPLGKVRASMDLILPKARTSGDRALGPFLARRFGREVVRVLAAPMLSGIYAGSVDELSTAATFPQLLEMEASHRSLILAHRRRPRGPSVPVSPFLTLDSGLASLIRALADAIEGGLIHLQMPLRGIARDSDQRYRLSFDQERTLVFDGVVCAVPSHVSASLLRPIAPPASEILERISYANLAVAVAIYRPTAVARALDRTGFLVPSGEGLNLTACTWVGAKWGFESPGVPMRLFFGRAGGEDVTRWTDDQFRAVIAREMQQTMGIREAPEYLRIFRWPRAMPQYEVGHAERIWELRQILERVPGLFLAGSALQGVGVPDCVRQANQSAEALARYLGLATPSAS